MYTVHKALLRKHGASEGNQEAYFVIGHPAVVSKTNTFTNSKFAGSKAQFFTATFRVMGEKRFLLSVSEFFPDGWTSDPTKTVDVKEVAMSWFKHHAMGLFQQHEAYARNNKVGLLTEVALTTGLSYSRNISTFADMKVTSDSAETAYFENKHMKFKVTDGENSGTEETVKKEKPAVKEPIAQMFDSRIDMTSLNMLLDVEGVFVKNGDLELFNSMEAISKFNTAANVLMIGPSGTGKTSIPEAFAKRKGIEYYYMDCATVRDPEEWFGRREAKSGSTFFNKSRFIQLVERGNVVIVLDEINRIEPWLHNSLYALLDHRRETVVYDEKVRVGEGTIFVATANIGTSFTGTFVLDAALTNRFDAVILTSFLPKETEADLICTRTKIDAKSANIIVDVMNAIRQMVKEGAELNIDFSTRTSLKLASLVANSKLPFKKILDVVMFSLIDDVTIVKQLNDRVNPIISAK